MELDSQPRPKAHDNLTMLRVLQTLRERPVLTSNEMSRRAGLSFPSAAKGMAAWRFLAKVRSR